MGNDRGAASVLVGISAVLVMLIASVALVMTRMLVMHTKASAAADLAALAAARAGSCDEAQRVAELNAAQLQSCEQDGGDFQVVVAVAVQPGQMQLRATARAGY